MVTSGEQSVTGRKGADEVLSPFILYDSVLL